MYTIRDIMDCLLSLKDEERERLDSIPGDDVEMYTEVATQDNVELFDEVRLLRHEMFVVHQDGDFLALEHMTGVRIHTWRKFIRVLPPLLREVKKVVDRSFKGVT